MNASFQGRDDVRSRARLVHSGARLMLRGIGLVLLVGCGSSPTVEEVIDKSAPAICDKAKECYEAAVFSTAFPGGVDECVTKVKTESKSSMKDKLDQTSVCDDAAVDKCLSDLKGAACSGQNQLPKPPCDC